MAAGLLLTGIGLMFIMGVFCLVIALYQLTYSTNVPKNVTPIPKQDDDQTEDQPKLTRLGRPIEEIRLRA